MLSSLSFACFSTRIPTNVLMWASSNSWYEYFRPLLLEGDDLAPEPMALVPQEPGAHTNLGQRLVAAASPTNG